MGKIKEGLDILIKVGVPREQQNERSSLTLLAILDLKKNTSWAGAKIVGISEGSIIVEQEGKCKYLEVGDSF